MQIIEDIEQVEGARGANVFHNLDQCGIIIKVIP